ncbi:MAG: dockerin type I domain-containing protein [Usitatibacteraceae bacterium]
MSIVVVPIADVLAAVYVRAPRYGDTTLADWPEVINPTKMEPGTDLMLLKPDGSEQVLFAAGNGAVIDPVVSFDAQSVYFSYFPDVRQSARNSQRANAPTQGADIYKINLASRQLTRLTQQTWTPPSGGIKWSTNHISASSPDAHYLGYGIFNMAPCPLPGGKIMFVSNREGYLPNKTYTFPNLRLYVMDDDGRNVEPVGHLNIGSAMHPTILKDGRVMFSSYESQGLRDQRVWSLWSILPDGRYWEPLMGSFKVGSAMHFQTQLSDGRIAVAEYYNLNNEGFGTLLAFNEEAPPGAAPFGSENALDASNPKVQRGIWFFQPGHPSHLQPRLTQYRFSPPGLSALTAFSHGEDEAASAVPGASAREQWAGKVTHPSGAPNNDVLMVWSPGPVNNLNRPTTMPRINGGIYVLKNGTAIDDPTKLVLIKNDPAYNEQFPRAVVPYSAIHGVSEPAKVAWLPNDGSEHAALPAGTPFGLVGTSTFYRRNTKPGNFEFLGNFNTHGNDENPNWFNQGSDAGKYSNDDIYAVRILAMEGMADRSYGPTEGAGFKAHQGRERLRILGEIPLKKKDASGNVILDPDGNPDTSFMAKIPADVAFTFQTIDSRGMVLNASQTWHQVRPGETRNDCGGCHAHAQAGLDIAQTAAGKPGYVPVDLTKTAPVLTRDQGGNVTLKTLTTRLLNIEYHRDIKPILQRSCVACHTQANPAANLALDDASIVGGFDNTYNRLADDTGAQYGYKPVISAKAWRGTNASRYIRSFQSRRSLLVWKVFGERLDGWTNASHPTESVPGNASTLPAGADANSADIDYTGTIMPPPGSNVPPLTEDEKMLIARWIDLGAPVDASDPTRAQFGWFNDEQKPTLTLSLPRGGANAGPLSEIRLGAFDNYSGLDRASLSVKANFAVNGKAAGSELAGDLIETGDHIWTIPLAQPLASIGDGAVNVSVKDLRGNQSSVARTFSIGAAAPLTLVSVQSRKTHGTAGTFDLPIDFSQPQSGAVTVEPRTIGAGHTIVFQFNQVISTVAGVSASAGAASVTSAGQEVLVNLAGVPDNSRATVSLTGVNGTSNASVSLGFLIGDVNGSRSVNSSDISGVKAHAGEGTTTANFRFDVNASGSVNSSDISAVKARSGLVLP